MSVVIFIMIPLSLIYLSAFIYIDKRRLDIISNNEELAEEIPDAKQNEHITCFQIKDSFQKVGLFMVNVFSVYFLEYSCTNGWAVAANPENKKINTGNFFENNAFVV